MLHTVTGLKLVLSKDCFSGHPDVPGLLTPEQRQQARDDYTALKPYIYRKDGRMKARIRADHREEFDRLMNITRADVVAQNTLRTVLGEKWLQETFGYKVGQKVKYRPYRGYLDPRKADTVWEGTITGATAPNSPYGGAVDLLFPGCGIGESDMRSSFQESMVLSSIASGALRVEQ